MDETYIQPEEETIDMQQVALERLEWEIEGLLPDTEAYLARNGFVIVPVTALHV